MLQIRVLHEKISSFLSSCKGFLQKHYDVLYIWVLAPIFAFALFMETIIISYGANDFFKMLINEFDFITDKNIYIIQSNFFEIVIWSAFIILVAPIFYAFGVPKIRSLEKRLVQTEEALQNKIDSDWKDLHKKLARDIKKIGSEQDEGSPDLRDEIEKLINGYLQRLGIKLGFEKRDINTDRLSIYLYTGGKYFTRIGRFSNNTKYRTRGRPLYPQFEGCIGEGWQHGWFFFNKFGKSPDDYVKINLDKFGMSPNIVKKINMQSRVYAVQRIGRTGKECAVLVVESINSKRFKESELKAVLKNEAKHLENLIDYVYDIVPTGKDARNASL